MLLSNNKQRLSKIFLITAGLAIVMLPTWLKAALVSDDECVLQWYSPNNFGMGAPAAAFSVVDILVTWKNVSKGGTLITNDTVWDATTRPPGAADIVLLELPSGPWYDPWNCDPITTENTGYIEYCDPADPGCGDYPTPTPTPPSLVFQVKKNNQSTWQSSLAAVAPLLGVDFRGIFSDFPGTVNTIRLDCTSDGTWDFDINVSGGLANPQVFSNADLDGSIAGCFQAYKNPGSYHASLQAVDSTDYSITKSLTIQVNNNNSPTALNVTVREPNYCLSGPGGTVEWTYSDPDNVPPGTDPQSGYQVQVDDQGSFNSPEIDSCPGGPPNGTCGSGGSSEGYAISSGTLQFNVTYRARVRVWDSNGLVSSWVNQSSCFGQGCQGGGGSWKTPKHAYPQVDFSWSPNPARANQLVNFTDLTIFSDGGGIGQRNYDWLSPGGVPPTGAGPNLTNYTTTYSVTGDYSFTETVTDKDGYTCNKVKSIPVKKSIPVIREVNPR